MSSKFSLVPVVTEQYGTLVDSRTGRRRLEDYFVVIGLPIGVAVISMVASWRIAIVGELISAVSIITGLLFALVIFLFQLRLQLGKQETAARIPRPAVKLIDEMFANVCYAIVVGFMVTGVTLVGAATRVNPTGPDPLEPINLALSAAVLALLTHFLLVLAMCLKRLVSAYEKVAAL